MRSRAVKSVAPRTPATAPVAMPVPMRTFDALAQNASRVAAYARSAPRANVNAPMGSGTTIGWSGWPAIAAALGTGALRTPIGAVSSGPTIERGSVALARRAAADRLWLVVADVAVASSAGLSFE